MQNAPYPFLVIFGCGPKTVPGIMLCPLVIIFLLQVPWGGGGPLTNLGVITNPFENIVRNLGHNVTLFLQTALYPAYFKNETQIRWLCCEQGGIHQWQSTE